MSALFAVPSAGRVPLAARLTSALLPYGPVICIVDEPEYSAYKVGLSEDVRVVPLEKSAYGMGRIRNAIMDQVGDEEYVIMVDDDTVFLDIDRLIGAFLSQMEAAPWLAALSSCPEFFLRGSERESLWVHPGDLDFRLVNNFYQAYILRVSALREAGPFRLAISEDFEMAMRLWGLGWGIGRLLWKGHRSCRPRPGKPGAQGGTSLIPGPIFDTLVKDGIDYLQANYGDVLSIKHLEGKASTHRVRVYWDKVVEPVRERFGAGLYADSSGRSI